MRRDEILELFRNITTWKRGDERAPHKPLLLLYALGRCTRGQGRIIPYRDVDDDLRKLLIEFGPRRQHVHPEYPFWRLQSDRVWVVQDAAQLERRVGNTDARRSELLDKNVGGGLTTEIFDALREDPGILREVAELILENHFPESMHEDILDAVGLEFQVSSLPRSKRDPEFRIKVLRAYERRCAVCGYDLRLGDHSLALEAAHIRWRQAQGPDLVDNGLALCVLHHKLFDRGAFTVDEQYRILVSQDVTGNTRLKDYLLAHHLTRIAEPQNRINFPRPEYLRWHYRQVFRIPPREGARTVA